MNALADINLGALERQLDDLEAADADTSAPAACRLDVDLRRLYRRALVARDEAAAYLVAREGWSYSDTAEATCGHRGHAERMHVLVDWTPPPESLDEPEAKLHGYQEVARGLRRLLARTHKLAVRALPATRIEQNLPGDPLQRLAFCAQWMRFTDSYSSSLLASRNLTAAILVSHHHWPLPAVARLAGTDEDQIAVASAAAAHTPPSDADSGMLEELSAVADAVAHNTRRLAAAGRQAVRQCVAAGVPRAAIEAYGGPLVA
jgi:hypothetical protein